MMDQLNFEKYCTRLGLSTQAIAYIERTRSSPPSRAVQSGRGNVTVRFPSEKMGRVIQAESHTVELPLIYLLENDASVPEFYDQPPRIQLDYKHASGRQIGVLHTPDYFVLCESGAGWYECKTQADLDSLVETAPGRYARQDGRYICPPGEEIAAKLGFFYRMHTPANTSPVLIDNLRLLRDYFSKDCPPVKDSVAELLTTIVSERPGMTIAELRLRACFELDELYALIAGGNLHVDLTAVTLVRHESARLFRDAQTSRAFASTVPLTRTHRPPRLNVGSRVTWKETVFTIVNTSTDGIFLRDPGGTVVSIARDEIIKRIDAGEILGTDIDFQQEQFAAVSDALKRASAADIEEAMRRQQMIEGKNGADVTVRTLNRWKKAYASADRTFGNGLVGLLPNTRMRGNRTKRHEESVQKIAERVIDSDYISPIKKTKLASYGLFRSECEKAGFINPPSYKWFVRQINKRTMYQRTQGRDGKRAAYQVAPQQHSDLDRNHGQRPWDVVHIDHTECEIELVCSETSRNLGRPWISVMIDGFSRAVLAFYLTFDQPSHRTCMMLARRCVERHHRLPSTIVVDGGKEFHSTYFQLLTALFKIEVAKRPPAQARFGSIIERNFGTVNTEFLYKLSGNTQVTRNVRQVTKSNNPRNHAVWTLEAVHDLIADYFFKFYFEAFHTGMTTTPQEAYARGMDKGGQRTHRIIPYNDDFVLLTLPTPPRGKAKVIPSKGFKLRGLLYWHNSMSDPAVEGSTIQIKYDPMNIGVAYAFISNQWVKCHSRHFGTFDGRTEKQWMIVTEELRRRNACAHRFRDLRARQAADFFQEARSTELELQVLKDAAQSRIDAARSSGTRREAGQTIIPFSSVAGMATPEAVAKSLMAGNPDSPTPIEIYGEF